MEHIVNHLTKDDCPENVKLFEIMDEYLDQYLKHDILNIFVTHTLSKKIHPISQESIEMGANPKYLQFCRDDRNLVGRAINGIKLHICLNTYYHRLTPKTLSQFRNIVFNQFGFVPDRSFCLHVFKRCKKSSFFVVLT